MDKRATIKDVAKLAGVSVATVSYIMNGKDNGKVTEETKKKVLQSINFLGYSPNIFASSLKTSPSRRIVLRLSSSLGNLWDNEAIHLLRELAKVANDESYITLSPNTKPEKLSHDTCICVGLPEEEFRALAIVNFVPFILVDAIINDPFFYQITDDYAVLKAEADKRFGEKNYTYLALTPNCPRLKEEIENTFHFCTFVSNIKDICSFSSENQNILVSQIAIMQQAVHLDSYSIFYLPRQDKARIILECVVGAINRTPVPDEAHFVKV